VKLKPIEIFRPGKHTANTGETLSFTEERVRRSAEVYDPNLHEAPIVVGHPRTDSPAFGWVADVAYSEGAGLEAIPHQVDAQFADSVRAGRYKKVSASFYKPDAPNNPVPGEFYLRHVGFLGAQPPSVKGLRPVEFGEEEEGVVALEFGEEAPEDERGLLRRVLGRLDQLLGQGGRRADFGDPPADPGATDPNAGAAGATDHSEGGDNVATEEELNERERQLKERERQIQEKETEAARKRRRAAAAAFAEDLVNQGKLLPAEKEPLVAFMERVDDSQSIEFGEEGNKATKAPGEWLQEFLAQALPERVDYGERTPGGDGAPKNPGYSPPQGYDVDPDKAAVHQQALQYAEDNQVPYEVAVQKVSQG
jgi:hypothetical protein